MIGFWADFFTFLQVAIGLFLIFIIMLQRGKGGGLVGALGGMGGASAFGPKADIQVLKLTIGLAIAWVVIACTGIFFNRSYATLTYNPVGDKAEVKSTDPKDKKLKDDEKKPGQAAASTTSDKGGSKDGQSKAETSEKDKTSTKTKLEKVSPPADNTAKPAKKTEEQSDKTKDP